MDTKIKIIKILPYWLIVLLTVIFTQSAAALFLTKAGADINSRPEVLGAFTETANPVRGDLNFEIKPVSQINKPDLSSVNAQSFLVFDLTGGQILLSKNPAKKLAIASLTKLMTGLVAYNNSSLNGSFIVPAKDTLSVRPSLGLTPGDTVNPLDVFNSMLIGSCNDAAKALAGFVARETGKNFVELMNSQARTLGMENSQFSNPMGFDSNGNYSTAEDLKLLITSVEKLSASTDLGRRENYSFTGDNNRTYFISATNTLIKNHSDIQAIKTGFTNEASGAMVTKITIGGRQIVILVLSSPTRESDTLKLKTAVTESFNWN